MNYLILGLIFIAGVIAGVGGSVLALLKTKGGTLRVDRSDPDSEPYMFLELTESLPSVMRKKYVIFRVNLENYISR